MLSSAKRIDAPSPITLYETGDRGSGVLYFSITADSSLATALQDTLRRCCGGSVNFPKIERIPQKHQSRIWIYIQAAAFSLAVHAVISDISEAELGPIVHINTSSQMGKSYAA